MAFSKPEADQCRRLVAMALEEDLGSRGDITSQAVISETFEAQATFVVRAAGVLAGLPAVELVLSAVPGTAKLQSLVAEGASLQPGSPVARVTGSLRAILAAERIALNFLQRLSGIASLTRRYVDAVAGLGCQILDTRKTTPGWRLLEKYAVRQGGGVNHRMGLFQHILIKDNHLAALAGTADPIRVALDAARARWGNEPVEIEVDTLEQLDRALVHRPAIILLDNMTFDQLREAVRRRNALAAPTLLEASGGVNLATVRAVAETGVDRISVGALTHSAPALDIGLDYGN